MNHWHTRTERKGRYVPVLFEHKVDDCEDDEDHKEDGGHGGCDYDLYTGLWGGCSWGDGGDVIGMVGVFNLS